MNAHWPKHKVYHKEQKERAKEVREGTLLEYDRSTADAAARLAEQTGDQFSKRFAEALALYNDGDLNAAAKAWRKIIMDDPAFPDSYFNLAIVLQQSGRDADAAQMFLKAMELHEDGTEPWAEAAAGAFKLLANDECHDAPKPEWWNDAALKALSARVVALAPEESSPCTMRAYVLSADSDSPWAVGPRTAAEIKEAATWFRRAAKVHRVPALERIHEQNANKCDKVAELLLAEEKAEAAEALKAREAAEAAKAEALKVAEAKAQAAAEELLAEEEKESQQVSTKAGKVKQSQGKKGKGKR